MKHSLLLLICITLLCSPQVHSIGSTQKDSIQTLMHQYNYGEALKLLNTALQVDPKNKEMLSYKGFVLQELYSYDQAIKAYADAVALDTTDVRLVTALANTYKLAHDYPNAVRCFTKAQALDSTNKYLKLEVATCMLLNNQYNEAISAFLPLYKADTLNTYVLKSLGYSFNQLEKYDISIFIFQKALKIMPNDPGSVLSLSNLYLKRRQYPAGITVTNDYRMLDSTNKEVNSKNAYFYLLDKNYPEATARFQKCIDAGDSSKFNFKNLGIAYYSINEYDKGKGYLEEAYALDPEEAGTLHFLGICCYRSFYKELGIGYLEEALKLYQPTEEKIALVYQNYSEACRGWDKCPTEKKIASTLRAYQLNPIDSSLALNLAYEYERAKDWPKAIQYHELYLNSLKTDETDVTDPSQRTLKKRHELELDQLKKKLITPATK
jgi:tetratricopeptide (TPR) repeat protein